ncbi:MAG: hypothetical protein AAFR61_03170 [Bacteroidota bacterium]
MKTRFFAFLFSFLSGTIAVQGQLTKGQLMIGGAGSMSVDQHRAYDRATVCINLSPSGGYFFTPKFVVGGELTYVFLHNKDQFNTLIRITPFLRFYIWEGNRWAIFSQAGFGFEKSKNRNQRNRLAFRNNRVNVGGNIGLAWFLRENIALEASMNYDYSVYSQLYGTHEAGLFAGFQIFLRELKDKRRG